MPRYFVRKPKADDDYYDRPMQPMNHPQVFQSEPVDTGLKDKDGNSIFKSIDRIGFLPTSD